METVFIKRSSHINKTRDGDSAHNQCQCRISSDWHFTTGHSQTIDNYQTKQSSEILPSNYKLYNRRIGL